MCDKLAPKELCTDCGACINICPKGAIKKKKDIDGHYFPFIDNNLCVDCKLCTSVCMHHKKLVKSEPINVYAVQNKNGNDLLKSASGGVFQALAKKILANGGVVVGASWDFSCKDSFLNHVVIKNEKELNHLLGSKYVKSNVDLCFKEIKTLLLNGKTVLFSGTPCQVMGLKNYLGTEYKNLITVDIICHGTPSQKMLQDYIYSEFNYDIDEIEDISFRDKSSGWGTNFDLILKNGHKIRKNCNSSSYIWFFYKGTFFRESCYSCIFAGDKRISDITVGDYWGIEKEHPESVRGSTKKLDVSTGVSCVLVNSRKGSDLIRSCSDSFYYIESNIEKVKKHNTQLNGSIGKSKDRDLFLKTFHEDGYCGLEKEYRKKIGLKYYYYILNGYIPKRIKYAIKLLIR